MLQTDGSSLYSRLQFRRGARKHTLQAARRDGTGRSLQGEGDIEDFMEPAALKKNPVRHFRTIAHRGPRAEISGVDVREG